MSDILRVTIFILAVVCLIHSIQFILLERRIRRLEDWILTKDDELREQARTIYERLTQMESPRRKRGVEEEA